MSMRRLAILIFVSLLLLGGSLWYFRRAPDEAERVREVIRAVVAGAEAGDVGDVMAPLSEDFVAESDGMSANKGTIRGVVTAQLLRRGHITVLLGDIAVTVDGPEAHASFDAILAEAGHDWTEVLPVDADSWHLEVELHRTDDAWQVTEATRTDAPILQ